MGKGTLGGALKSFEIAANAVEKTQVLRRVENPVKGGKKRSREKLRSEGPHSLYLAGQLVRQTTKKPLLSHARPTEDKIVALLGPRWRPDPKAPPPAPTNDIPVIPPPGGAA